MDGQKGLSIPVITTDQMVEVDRLMIEEYGIQLIQMMENAGRNLAEQAGRMLGGELARRRIAVLCGKGNNGGGGMVAARHLHNRGADVQVKLAGDPGSLEGVPKQQWRILSIMRLPEPDERDLHQVDLIIDAMIGYGLSGNPRGQVAEWVARANASLRPILALDAPTGLNTTSGTVGRPMIRAAATLTLALPKTGLMSEQARFYVGELYLADIGVPPELYRRLELDVPVLFERDTILRIST
ncbi:MAG: NAD(P)H-hydrate epimerase [Anaerolineales bacterium]|jgi:NAD(P)H-hydrate epimerase